MSGLRESESAASAERCSLVSVPLLLAVSAVYLQSVDDINTCLSVFVRGCAVIVNGQLKLVT